MQQRVTEAMSVVVDVGLISGKTDDQLTVKEAKLETGTLLTLQLRRGLQASQEAFAAILTDGSVVTWGSPGSDGNSRAVKDQLKGVQQIQASYSAFAAILPDGSVVTWGHAGYGGNAADTSLS